MKIFVLTFKHDLEQRFYTTISALCEENTHKELGVAKRTLYGVDFSQENYNNNLIEIKEVIIKKRQDIQRERERFL